MSGRAVRGRKYQLGGIKPPMAADPPCPRNSAGSSRPRECLRMDAEALCRLARGEETVLRGALTEQHPKLLTCPWVRAQLVKNRQHECVRHSRIRAGPLGRSSNVVMRVGGEVCCGWHVLAILLRA